MFLWFYNKIVTKIRDFNRLQFRTPIFGPLQIVFVMLVYYGIFTITVHIIVTNHFHRMNLVKSTIPCLCFKYQISKNYIIRILNFRKFSYMEAARKRKTLCLCRSRWELLITLNTNQ